MTQTTTLERIHQAARVDSAPRAFSGLPAQDRQIGGADHRRLLRLLQQ